MDKPANSGPRELVIRRFRLRDLRDILRIEREAFRQYAYGTWTFLSHALRDRGGFFVADDGSGRVLGFALVRRSGGWILPRRGGITSIAVDAPFRRQGIGSRLLADVLQFLREFGAEEITLEVHPDNKAASALYQRFGFRRKEWLPNYYGPAQPGIRMILGQQEREAD